MKIQIIIERLTKNKWLAGFMLFTVFGLVLAGSIYFTIAGNRVIIEDSQVTAPTIGLSSVIPGVLEEVYVEEGEEILANTVVARVGNELVKSSSGGMIISTSKNIGAITNPTQPIVTMINTEDLRAVGSIGENKGLSDVHVGQQAMFTVDAFDSKQYTGVIDEVSSQSAASGMAFSISDKRPVKTFDIKVRFDVAKYPELKNGMSAKITVYK